MEDKKGALAVISTETQTLKEQVMSKQITCVEDLHQANDLLKQIKTRIKKVEEKRVHYKEPFLEGARRVDTDFKPYILALEDVRRIIEKEKIIPYQQAEERREREAAEKKRQAEIKEQEEKRKVLEELAKKTKSEEAARRAKEAEIRQKELEAMPLPKVVTTVRSKKATGSLKKAWKFEIIDANIVPIEYKMVDDRKVKDAIKYGIREIKGLRIYEETTGVTTR